MRKEIQISLKWDELLEFAAELDEMPKVKLWFKRIADALVLKGIEFQVTQLEEFQL